MKKVILISIDGMRPDGFLQCGNPFAEEIMKRAYYTLNGRTVRPSVTLPCHMSLFHSVKPERHGITTNYYIPMARPIKGLFEQLAGKRFEGGSILDIAPTVAKLMDVPPAPEWEGKTVF